MRIDDFWKFYITREKTCHSMYIRTFSNQEKKCEIKIGLKTESSTMTWTIWVTNTEGFEEDFIRAFRVGVKSGE